MRSAEQAVVVAVHRDVQRLADDPRRARRGDVAADRVRHHPGVGGGDRAADAAAVVADQDVQHGGDERAEHRGALVLADLAEPGDRLRFGVGLAADRDAADRPRLGMVLPVSRRAGTR